MTRPLSVEFQTQQAVAALRDFRQEVNKSTKDVAKMRKALDLGEKQQKKLAGSTAKSTATQQSWNRVMGKSQRVTEAVFRQIKRLALVFGTLTAAIAVATIKLAVDFEQEMVKIETLVGINRRQVQAWTKDLLNLSIKTGQSAKNLARGLFAITSGGERGSQAIDQLAISAKAAAIGMGDIRDIGRLGAAAMQAYGSEITDAAERTEKFAEIMDSLVVAVRLGNINAEELTGTIGRALGPAQALGVSFQELAAFTATFSRLGVPAAEVITAINSTFTTLIRESDRANESLQQYGLTSQDVRDRIRNNGLADTLVFLVRTYGDNISGLQDLISNIRALRGVLGTASAQQANYLLIADETAKAINVVSDAFDRQKETTAQAFKEIRSAGEALLITMGNELLPVFREVANSLVDALASQSVTKAFQDLGKAAAEFAANFPAEKIIKSIERMVRSLETFLRMWPQIQAAIEAAAVVFALNAMVTAGNSLEIALVRVTQAFTAAAGAAKGFSTVVVAINSIGLPALIALFGLLVFWIRKTNLEMEQLSTQFDFVDQEEERIEKIIMAMERLGRTVQKVDPKTGDITELQVPVPTEELESFEAEFERILQRRADLNEELGKAGANVIQRENDLMIQGREILSSIIEDRERLNQLRAEGADTGVIVELNREIQSQKNTLKAISDELQNITAEYGPQLAELNNLNAQMVRFKDQLLRLKSIPPIEIVSKKAGSEGAGEVAKINKEFQKLTEQLQNQQDVLALNLSLLEQGVDPLDAQNKTYLSILNRITAYNAKAKDADKLTFEQQVKLLEQAQAVDSLIANETRLTKELEKQKKFRADVLNFTKDIESSIKEVKKQITALNSGGRLSAEAMADFRLETEFTVLEMESLKDTFNAVAGSSEYEFLRQKLIELYELEHMLKWEAEMQRIMAQAASDFGTLLGETLGEAFRTLGGSGNIAQVLGDAAKQAGSIFGNAVGQGITQSMRDAGKGDALSQFAGAFASAGTSAVIGLIIDGALGFLSKKNDKKVFGTVNIESGQLVGLEDAAQELKTAARALQDAADQVQTITGIGIEFPGFDLSQVGDEFHADSSQLGFLGASGVGSSVEEAVNDFIFNFLKNFGKLNDNLRAAGVFEELGIAIDERFDTLITIINNSTAQNLDELIEDIKAGFDIFNLALGEMGADVFNQLNEISVLINKGVQLGLDPELIRSAVNNALRSVVLDFGGFSVTDVSEINKAFRRLKKGINDLSDDADEAKRSIDLLKLGRLKRINDAQISVADSILGIMERTGIRNEKVQRQIGKLKQAEFRIQLAILEVQARALNLWTRAMRQLFEEFEEFAKDLNNFIPRFDVDAVSTPSTSGRSTSSRSGPTRAQRIADLLEFVIGHELNDFQKSIFDLAVEFRDAQREAEALGVLQDRVNIARVKAIKDIIDGVFQPIEEALASLQTDQRRFNPVQNLAVVQQQFADLIAAAQAGDVEAFQQIPQAQQDLLDFGQQFFGSNTGAFQAMFGEVQAQLEALLSSRDDILNELFTDAELQQVKELEKQTSLLDQIKEAIELGNKFSDQRFKADQGAGSGGGGGGSVGSGSSGSGGSGGGGAQGIDWRVNGPSFDGVLDAAQRSRLRSIAEALFESGQIPSTGGAGSVVGRITPGDLHYWLDNGVNFGGGGNRRFVRDLVGRRFGGSITPRTAFLVGEAGPELLVTGTPGNVIPFPQEAQLPNSADSAMLSSQEIIDAIRTGAIAQVSATRDQTDVLTDLSEAVQNPDAEEALEQDQSTASLSTAAERLRSLRRSA